MHNNQQTSNNNNKKTNSKRRTPNNNQQPAHTSQQQTTSNHQPTNDKHQPTAQDRLVALRLGRAELLLLLGVLLRVLLFLVVGILATGPGFLGGGVLWERVRSGCCGERGRG